MNELARAFDQHRATLLAALRASLSRNRLPPYGVQDAEDLLHDCFLRLAKSEWKRRFDASHPAAAAYLRRRVLYFARERSAAARGRGSLCFVEPSVLSTQVPDAATDRMDAAIEAEWRRRAVRDCLARVESVNPDWALALRADMTSPGPFPAADVGRRLNRTADGAYGILRRARREFARQFALLARRASKSPAATPRSAIPEERA